jgi:hypothetical protein
MGCCAPAPNGELEHGGFTEAGLESARRRVADEVVSAPPVRHEHPLRCRCAHDLVEHQHICPAMRSALT